MPLAVGKGSEAALWKIPMPVPVPMIPLPVGNRAREKLPLMVALWKIPVPVPIIPLPVRENREEGKGCGP